MRHPCDERSRDNFERLDSVSENTRLGRCGDARNGIPQRILSNSLPKTGNANTSTSGWQLFLTHLEWCFDPPMGRHTTIATLDSYFSPQCHHPSFLCVCFGRSLSSLLSLTIAPGPPVSTVAIWRRRLLLGVGSPSFFCRGRGRLPSYVCFL
jgi:hypothetical protein